MAKKVDNHDTEMQKERCRPGPHDPQPLDLREAIVYVQPGESKEEAWSRHVFENPQDDEAVVKIFIIPDPRAAE